jgi:hypothetical protein
MNLANIKAIPNSLTRNSAFTITNKIFPFIEYYSCSPEEKEALRNKIKYDGMTVGRIGNVSDFMGGGSVRGHESMLRATARHHDLVCVPVSDPAESSLPDVGLVELEDPETGELTLVDTSSAQVRRAFAAAAEEDAEELRRFFTKTGIDTLAISTDRPYINEVRNLFKRRAGKR